MNLISQLGFRPFVLSEPLKLAEIKAYLLEHSQTGLQGFLVDIGILDFIQMALRSREQKHLKIRDNLETQTGTLYFQNGQLLQAEFEDISGEAALMKIFQIRQGLFFEQEWQTPSNKELESIPPHKLLLKAPIPQSQNENQHFQVSPELLNSIDLRLKNNAMRDKISLIKRYVDFGN